LNWADYMYQLGAATRDIENWHLEERLARNELEQLARAYGENTCWNPSSPWWYPYSGGYTYQYMFGSAIAYVCNFEMWEISYDGGATWQPIEVKVCEFAIM